MSDKIQESSSPKSLASMYWDALDSHCKEIELIPIEEIDRRIRSVQLHQLRLSMLVDQLLEVSREFSPEAWFALADAYQMGRGAPKSRPAAMRWLQRAAEAGNISAMMRFASSLQHPDFENDPCRAVEWYRKVAERGHSTGMVSLGFSYREGQGVARDLGQAVHWFSKAVEAGDSHALIYIGRLYRDMPHRTEAVSWFLRAAETGHEESHIELARLYDERESPVYDPAEAVKWLKKVADSAGGRNYRDRDMIALARHFWDGTGVEKDPEMARIVLRRILKETKQRSLWHREAAELLKGIERRTGGSESRRKGSKKGCSMPRSRKRA